MNSTADGRRVFPLEPVVGRVLHLTLKRRWFEMVASGEKREEYREIKPYWTKRFCAPGVYDVVQFRNGYRPDSPTVRVELEGIFSGLGHKKWGAPDSRVYVLRLGALLPNSELRRVGAGEQNHE